MHRQAAEQFRALGQEALAASHDRHADTIMEHLESSGGTRRRSPAAGRMGQGVGGPLK